MVFMLRMTNSEPWGYIGDGKMLRFIPRAIYSESVGAIAKIQIVAIYLLMVAVSRSHRCSGFREQLLE